MPVQQLPDATNRFLDAVSAIGFAIVPQVFSAGTRTSADAARAVGCELSAIAKSLVFMADDEAVLVLMPGDKRVDTVKLAVWCGVASTRRATLDEARQHTGYAAGGTPAFGLATDLRAFADVGLRRHTDVWSAAGAPTTLYRIAVSDLISASGANWADLAE